MGFRGGLRPLSLWHRLGSAHRGLDTVISTLPPKASKGPEDLLHLYPSLEDFRESEPNPEP